VLAYDPAVSLGPAAPRLVRRVSIANLGCKVNQAEMDDVERLLRARGVELVGGREPADLVVVNTCTVTAVADRKSRQAVRRARRSNPAGQVLVTGCSVAVDRESLAGADPAARLYDNNSKNRLLADLAEMVEVPDGAATPTISGPDRASERGTAPAVRPGRGPAFELETEEGSVEDQFGDRADIDRTRAYVKIQDGCSFHCTYCIIPRARGPERSLAPDTVLAAVGSAVAAGHREVVLTGINAGTYDGTSSGEEGERPLRLPGLVRRILAETNVERIRLSSIEPQHLSDELLDVWVGSAGRCLPHFHVPLQSGDDAILRRMGRRYDTNSYADLAARVRRAMPNAAVHADLIVGFPGEDEASWARTATFLRTLDLAGIHVFRYSARPGTPAARMVGQVDAGTKKRRAAEALALATAARASFAAQQLGGEMVVLFERPLADGRWLGHAENHVLVATAPPDGGSLGNAIGTVRAEGIDPAAADRVVGHLLAVDRGRLASCRRPASHEWGATHAQRVLPFAEPLACAARK